MAKTKLYTLDHFGRRIAGFLMTCEMLNGEGQYADMKKSKLPYLLIFWHRSVR